MLVLIWEYFSHLQILNFIKSQLQGRKLDVFCFFKVLHELSTNINWPGLNGMRHRSSDSVGFDWGYTALVYCKDCGYGSSLYAKLDTNIFQMGKEGIL